MRASQAGEPPSAAGGGRSGSSSWPERTSSMWASNSCGSLVTSPAGHT